MAKKCISCENMTDNRFLCNECKDRLDKVISNYWVVTRFGLSTDAMRFGRGVAYPFIVEGHYRDKPRESFFWHVPDIVDKSYDLSHARFVDFKLDVANEI